MRHTRRNLLHALAGFGLAASTWSLAACRGGGVPATAPPTVTGNGPRAGRVARIGVLAFSAPEVQEAGWRPLREALALLGWVDGVNITYDLRGAGGDPARHRADVEKFVQSGVDVIVTGDPPSVRAARDATTTIPIVIAQGTSDPVADRLVASLDRPGRNITGVAGPPQEASSAKVVEVLKDVMPALQRVGVIWDTSTFGSWASAGAEATSPEFARVAPVFIRLYDAAARDLALEIVPLEVAGPDALPDVFTRAHDIGIEAVYFQFTARLGQGNAASMQIADLAARRRIALATVFAAFKHGALVTYGVDTSNQSHDVAGYVDRILRGARPAETPMRRPDRYHFIVNLKIAAALGLTIPPAALARATEVIV